MVHIVPVVHHLVAPPLVVHLVVRLQGVQHCVLQCVPLSVLHGVLQCVLLQGVPQGVLQGVLQAR